MSLTLRKAFNNFILKTYIIMDSLGLFYTMIKNRKNGRANAMMLSVSLNIPLEWHLLSNMETDLIHPREVTLLEG